MRVVGYIRVSRVGKRDGERFISPAEQRKAIVAWADLHGHSIVEVIEDLDQPGTKRDRPGLERALGLIEASRAQGVVVAKLDRFGRSVPHLGQLLDLLARHDAALFTVAEGIDTSGRAGRMIATILSAIAEFEVSRIGETWFQARENAVSRGVWVRWTVPLGYEKDADGRLHPDKAAPLVREVFLRRAGGESWTALARWLGDQLDMPISTQRVRYLIQSRAYLGESFGDQGIENLEAHEPLVSPSEWEAANGVRGSRPRRSGRATRPLTGLARCASCRYALKPSVRGRTGAVDYVCKTNAKQSGSQTCSGPVGIAADKLDTYVLEAFWDFAEAARMRRADPSERISVALADLERAEQRRDAAVSDRLGDILGPGGDAHLAVIDKAQVEVERCQAIVDELTASEVDLPDVDLRAEWGNFDVEQQRQLLASTIDCVFLRRSARPGPGTPTGERVHICWRGSGPTLPRPGVLWVPRPYDFPPPLGVPLGHDGDQGT